jgi:hypothetical protein
LPRTSYAEIRVSRLDHRNGLGRRTLSKLVKASDLPPLAAISTLSGLPPTHLTAALPELRVSLPTRAMRSRHLYLGFVGKQIACHQCAARHGSAIAAIVWSDNHDTICPRHRRWLGSPFLHSDTQLSLLAAPEVVAANRHHRQLVHRHGRVLAEPAFTKAVTIVEDWHRRDVLPGVRERIRRLFDGKMPHHVSTTAPQVLAAHYPAAVRLTRLLTTPGWLLNATSGPDGWNDAAHQISNHITGGYRPTTANRDALEQLRLYPDLQPHPSWRATS